MTDLSGCSDLAVRIAKAIFGESIKGSTETCRRIQFMGGEYPDKEIKMGGYNEAAFALRIDKVLREQLFIKGS